MDTDAELMDRARALGDRVRRHTAPNPWVGCVLTAGGTIVGEGATQPPGGAHAEVEALRAAGARARGATAYVTLEPCAHHGRTGPCAEALVAAGVARVVVALEDPDPRVGGRGLDALRAAGVAVDVGVGAHAVARSLGPYLGHRRLGRSFVLLKTAMSLDGRIAPAPGSPATALGRWITGPEARVDAHGLRADSQAVMVGAGTALHDRPTLTARDADPPAARQPLRVLLDGRGRVPAEGPLFDPALAPTLVFTTVAAPEPATAAWLAAGAKVTVLPAGSTGTGVDLHAALATLGELGVLQVLVEGGAAVAGALLDAGLVDRLVAYVAPTILGRDALPAFATGSLHRFELVDTVRVGADLRCTFEPGTA
jgi:diaminohydroxyphosphoribosylaminopyrimidine deaminase/5-amino-6-(5-phosphoribosylamino)uracil reductase